MPKIVSDGKTIHYTEHGVGTVAVLVHSGGMSSRQWTRLGARLSRTHRVLAPDLLGSGASDGVPHDEAFDYGSDVRVVETLMDLSDAPVHLVGHSYGGLVALTAARKRSSRVRSLSLYEPVAFGVLHSTQDAPGLANLHETDPDGTFLDDGPGGTEPWLERFINYWNGPGSWRALPAATRAAFVKTGRKIFQEVRSLLHDRTPHTAYASLKIPCLLLTGERSPAAAQRVCAILAETMPRGAVATIPVAGHMAPLTHGDQVNQRIVEHIESSER